MTYVMRWLAALMLIVALPAGAEVAMEPRQVAANAWYVQGAAALG